MQGTLKQSIIVLIVGFLAQGALAQDASAPATLDIRAAQGLSLDDFLWLNRLVIVFADSDRDPAYQKQLAFLNDQPTAMNERDVVVITDTDRANPSAIRQRLHPRGFGLVLIDKDGLIKLRKPSPWDVREISHSIDKTDLRQQELRDQRAVPSPEPGNG